MKTSRPKMPDSMVQHCPRHFFVFAVTMNFLLTSDIREHMSYLAGSIHDGDSCS